MKRRIIELSWKFKLSHISSCLTSVDLIDIIYRSRQSNDPFILSNGHAGLALYCILEKYNNRNAEELYKKHGVHPNRDVENGIYFSTGSLGQGFPTALGMALSHDGNVYCLTSDGEMMEGSMWESLRIAAELKMNNLYLYVNANGTGAYREIDSKRLQWQIGAFITNGLPKVAFLNTNLNGYPKWLQGIGGHYAVMDKEMYNEIMEVLQ